MENDDAVARARAGDVEAFGEIVECYQAAILRYLYRLTGDVEMARDLAQDTFVQAYRTISKTTADLPVRAWLYRIATNNAFQHRRRTRARAILQLDPETEAEMDNAGAADPSLEGLEVQEALLEIPAKLRVCMVLHYVDGFKYREIAETLGISEDAVRMRVARGSEEFRNRFRDEGGELK